jgi:hypothetical protein
MGPTARSLDEALVRAFGAALRGGAAAAAGSRLRGGAFGLERRDRPAARPDRPVCGSGRCDPRGRLRARQRPLVSVRCRRGKG